MQEQSKKICFAASSGGHYEQLMMLKSLMQRYDSIIVTEKTGYNSETQGVKTYYLKQVNRREISFIPKMIANLFISIQVYKKEKPDIIVSTGALATIPILIICKLNKKKLVFIESFAKVNSATKTGRLMYKIADRFYVQWEEMLKVYPNAVYAGSIY